MSERIRLVTWSVLIGVPLLVIFGGILWFRNPIRESTTRDYADAMFASKVVTLAPRIHFLGRTDPGAVYVVETSSGLVFVDSGLNADGSEVLAQLRELGLNVTRLKAILLTHSHGDHTLGARAFREMSGAKVYAGEGDTAVLQAGGPRDAFFSTFAMDAYAIHATHIDVPIKGGEVIQMGDTRIEALATPGHTPGSVCYLLTRGKLRVLFTGDTISSLVGDLGTYSASLPPRFGGNARDYLATLRRLRAMPVPDLVLPGHPMSRGVPANSPRLTESAWRALLDRGIRELEILEQRYSEDGADFLDGIPKELLPGLHYLGEYQQRAVYVLVTPSGQFLFDAPGDPGIAQFIEEGLKRVGVESPSLTAILLTSCDPAATGGLETLIEKYGSSIVVSDVGRELIAARCPVGTKLVSPIELAAASWFPVEVMPLNGLGVGALAYSLSWEDKQILVSGRIPLKISDAFVRKLFAEWRSPTGNPLGYQRSMIELQQLHPDLWLPAEPLFGQNANLYDDAWDQTLQQHLKLFGR